MGLIGGIVRVDSNGTHEVITTITPCTGCNEPKSSVTTNCTTITPTAFQWDWAIAANQGTREGGAMFSTTVNMESPEKHSTAISATATNDSSCCACSAAATTNTLVMQIDSETWREREDLDPRRRKLGVGEEIILTLIPDSESGEWQWYNPKKRQQAIATNNVIRIQNRYTEGAFPVTFSHISSLSALLPFTAVQPSGYNASVLSNYKFGQGIAGVRALIGIDFLPEDVSWAYVVGMEIGVISQDAEGWFEDKHTLHDHSKHGANNPFSLVNKRDPIEFSAVAEPWSYGFMSWPTPAVWWIGDDPYNQTNSPLPWSESQRFYLTSDGTATIVKFGLTVSRNTNNVCVPYPQ